MTFTEASLSSEVGAQDCPALAGEPAMPTGGRLTDALARKYMVRVLAHAKRLARRLPAHVSLGDLVSAGMLGVVEGFLRYDRSRMETLDAYIDHRIRGALLDELRRHDPLTRVQRDFARQLTRATRAGGNVGARPSDESLASALGLSVEALRERVTHVTTATALQTTGGPDADEFYDHEPNPEEALDARQHRSLLAVAAATLPPRDREMLALYYENGETFREIGARFGVTESRVSQVHSRAIERLRATLSA